jgi:hypothetical protein
MEKSASNSAHEGKLEAADFSVAVDDCHRCNAMRCDATSSLCHVSLAVSDVCMVDGDDRAMLVRHLLALQGHVLGHDRTDL